MRCFGGASHGLSTYTVKVGVAIGMTTIAMPIMSGASDDRARTSVRERYRSGTSNRAT